MIGVLATTLVVAGMLLLSPGWLISVKLIAVWLFVYLTSPTAGHAVANAAHIAGLEPLIGPQARGEDEGGAQ